MIEAAILYYAKPNVRDVLRFSTTGYKLSTVALTPPYISLNLHLAKCYRQPYHTTPPPNCQGLFSFGGTEPGGNGKTATPPPARPRAGALPQRAAARRPGSLLAAKKLHSRA